jgi:peptide deformylase
MLNIVRRMRAVGLSSNQVGVDLRMFVAILNGKPYVMLNPVITPLTTIEYASKEGCLSVPGYTDTVERIAHIEVEWRGVDGAHLHEEFMEFNASVIQHETDHLDGILFIDNLSSIKQARARKKVDFWKRRNNSKGRSSYKPQETA